MTEDRNTVAIVERELGLQFASLAAIPCVSLGRFPTPLESAPGLADAAGVAEVWVKRDDQSAERYGGNKVRRLEFLLGDALAAGARGVWTAGSLGSNHVLATAIYGRSLGLEVRVRHYPQPLTTAVRDTVRWVAASGATMRLGGLASLPFGMARARWRARSSRRPSHLHVLPGGGSSALGALGYVEAALELAAQIGRRELPKPDAVVVPVGSGGTLAGLVVGFELAGLEVPVIGVRVVDRIVVNRWNLNRLIRGAARLLRRHDVPVFAWGPSRRYRIVHNQFGKGYGIETPAARVAVELARDAGGLALETTYSAKAMAGVLASGRDWVGEGGRLLFVATANSRPPEPTSEAGLPSAYERVFARLRLA